VSAGALAGGSSTGADMGAGADSALATASVPGIPGCMGGAGAAAASALATFISAATPQPLPKSVIEAESANPKPGNLWRMTPRKRGRRLGLTRFRSI
jgi:hypothetical protein